MRLNKHHRRLIIMLFAYLLLKFFGGSFGQLVLYPINLLVAFLHEMGHALGALLTGGRVEGMQINANGSGYTKTRGGMIGVIIMGGYIGSAVLGNLLFYIGVKKKQLSQISLRILSGLMVMAGIIWFQSFESTGILLVFAAGLWLIASKTNWDQEVLMFLGLAAVLYIIEDFNVGPSSDLAMYEKMVGGPATIWMYVWLGIAVILFIWNIKLIFSR